MFVAPQTISSTSSPTRTRVSERRSARGWRATSSSSPVTTFRQSAPQRSIPLTSIPSKREALGELLGVELDIDVVAEPGERDPHRNCPRKRRSSSRKTRMSVIPWRSIAIRSTPIPKAKPW